MDDAPGPVRPVVWVVGDAMIDVTHYAEASRFAQEDPAVPVLRLTGVGRREPGGAANVAANLAAMGCEVHLFSAVGRDPDVVSALQDVCESADVRTHFGRLGSADSRTPRKNRYLVGDRLAARVDDESDIRLSALEPSQFSPEEEVGTPSCLVFSDYDKGTVGTAENMIAWLVYASERAGPSGPAVRVFVDPSRSRWAEYLRLPPAWAVFTPNRDEAAALTGGVCVGSRPGPYVTHLLTAMTPASEVYLKLGASGVVWAGRSGHQVPTPAYRPAQVYDVQGAGDTFLAGLVAASARRLPSALVAEYAVAAAGIAVGRPGTSVVCSSDVTAALRPTLCRPVRWPVGRNQDNPDLYAQMTFLSYSAAAKAVAAGLKVGFTNGCFDLLGPHHIHFLRETAARCDFLVVGIDSDERVAALKGPDRPIVSAADRAAQVSAVDGVGAVLVFDTDPSTVVEQLRPSVMFKGSDYAGKAVSGAGRLASWGGELVLIPNVEGPSTTERIARIRGKS